MTHEEAELFVLCTELSDAKEHRLNDRLVVFEKRVHDVARLEEINVFDVLVICVRGTVVGGVISYGYDVQWVIFPEYRGRGYMSAVARSGLIRGLRPNGISFESGSAKSRHIAFLAGLIDADGYFIPPAVPNDIPDRERRMVSGLFIADAFWERHVMFEKVKTRRPELFRRIQVSQQRALAGKSPKMIEAETRPVLERA